MAVLPGMATPPVSRPSDSALHISRLTKSFGGVPALRSVEIDVRAGEIHALVGENGAGKSTLIKVLAGYHAPDDGADIRVAGQPLAHGSVVGSYRRGCRFVHQDLGLVDSLSVAENISLSNGYPCRFGTIRRRHWRDEVDAALARVNLELDPDQLLGELPAAARTGVAVARALRADHESQVFLLVLDEPTAALPAPQVADLHRMIRRVAASGVGVLYVSHRLREIFEIAHTVTVMRDGATVATRPTAELDHASLVHLMIGGEPAQRSARHRRASTTEPVLDIRGVASGQLLSMSLAAYPGEIVGVAGITGSGRENVLAAVFGAIPRDAGSVTVAGEPLTAGSPRRAMAAGVAYLPPDRKSKGGLLTLSAAENLTLADVRDIWRFPFMRRRVERAEALRWFGHLDVRPPDAVERRLETFSGGNQQKIILGKWLRTSPKVLLLDEPTQGVDVSAKALLHAHFISASDSGTCLVVSSSDNDELADLCDRVIVLSDGFVTEELVGADITPGAITRATFGRQTRWS